MKLSAVRVNVADIAVAKDFYGATLGLKQAWDWGTAVGYDVGATLIIETHDPNDPEHRELVGRFVGCSLAVDDIEETFRKLVANGVIFVAAPEKMPWGGVLAHFKDPSGNILTLVQY